MGPRKVIACLKKHKSFLITSHVNLEGDALGSELAFYNLVKKLNKRAVIVNQDKLPYGYDFLPKKNIIKKFAKDIQRVEFDCFVVLDCSDLSRTGQVYKINLQQKPILNIDHHISNQMFGDVNWLDPNSSSCCETIYKLYKKLRIPIDKETAIFLYVGILTDTGSFRYANTTGFTHKMAADLLRHNLDVKEIYKKIYENIPFLDMKLLSRVLPRIKQEAGGRIIWFEINRSMLRDKKLSFDLSEHILSFGRAVKDAEVVVLFKENLGVKDQVRMNFRSQGRVDVNKIARFFGGGGHKTASGATMHGKLDTVRKKVLARIRKSLK